MRRLEKPEQLTAETIRRAVVEKNTASIQVMVQTLNAIIHSRVARVLVRRRAGSRGRDLRQDVEDITQEVFVAFLENGGQILLSWAPEKGSAAAFFGLIAERRTHNILDSRKQSPWTEEPSEIDRLERPRGGEADVEKQISTRHMLRVLGERLLVELSERDRILFELLYLKRLDDEKVRQKLSLSRDVLYQARKRLLSRVRNIARKLGPEFEALVGVKQ